jgi:uncharacterized metal-binding protein YceD (DUF177 family)
MSAPGETPEFSRLLRFDAIGADGTAERTLTASDAECAALAARLGLEALSGFHAELVVTRLPAGEIGVRGHIVADVVQACVVTLEPVPDRIDDEFEVRFTTRAELPSRDVVIGLGDEEPPEPIEGDILDLGELTAQQLSLSLNPWPRRPDAAIPPEAAPDPARDGPFAALAALRDKASGPNK